MLLEILLHINEFVWGFPLIFLLIGTGIWLTIRLKFLQILKLGKAFQLIISNSNQGKGDITPFKALCTALAATLGTGNIAGVATAIKIGGPGALFWMWIAALFGMATKYAEGLLAVKYREINADGKISGGPMYYIKNGMGPKFKWLAFLFAFFGMLAGILGIGTMTHVNTITQMVNIATGADTVIVGLVIAFFVAVIILGGIRSISDTSGFIVPLMAIIYFLITVSIIILNIEQVPHVIRSIIHDAFTGTAATGGFLGSTVVMAMRGGIARGLYSNESGLGSAPIVAAAAKTNWPAEQGLVSMTGTFIDTIIFCSLTGICLVITGVWTNSSDGIIMTNQALASVYPNIGKYFLMISITLFAFSSILGWCYYAERCCVYLFGIKSLLTFRLVFVAVVTSASFFNMEEIWTIADIFNGLMAFPNLIALLALNQVIIKETNNYLKYLKQKKK